LQKLRIREINWKLKRNGFVLTDIATMKTGKNESLGRALAAYSMTPIKI
jgi:hypothetical protein